MPADSASVSLYPVALDLRGRQCVVIGGGAVAARKAEALIEAGAEVVVVAPTVGEGMRELIAAKSVKYLEEPFMPAHLDDMFLVIAATDHPDVNGSVVAAARERGVLVNLAAPPPAANASSAGDLESGDFVTMAAVRRGDLLLAITTGGAGPALSARIKRDFEAQFGREWDPYVTLLRDMRVEAKRRISDDGARAVALRRLAAEDSIRCLIQAGDTAGALREALACLS